MKKSIKKKYSKFYSKHQWWRDKAFRAEYYYRFIFCFSLRECGACAGSGYYDDTGSPKCWGCAGTGKEKYRASSFDWESNFRQNCPLLYELLSFIITKETKWNH